MTVWLSHSSIFIFPVTGLVWMKCVVAFNKRYFVRSEVVQMDIWKEGGRKGCHLV